MRSERERARTLPQGSGLGEGLLQVFQDIVRILDPHGEADQPIADPGLEPSLAWDRGASPRE
jgi:hypothetical protein